MTQAVIDIGELLEVTEGVCGGRPRLRGTRLPVQLIAELHLGGATVDEIVDDYERATPAAVYAALAYYFAHKDEMDADIEADARFVAEALAEQERAFDRARQQRAG